jgi:hypothetical protein
MGFWYDGAPISPDPSVPVNEFGAGNNSYWSGGRLYAGQRANVQCTDDGGQTFRPCANSTGGNAKLGYITWLSTLNGGNTTTGQVNLDRVAISTVGRIGP